MWNQQEHLENKWPKQISKDSSGKCIVVSEKILWLEEEWSRNQCGQEVVQRDKANYYKRNLVLGWISFKGNNACMTIKWFQGFFLWCDYRASFKALGKFILNKASRVIRYLVIVDMNIDSGHVCLSEKLLLWMCYWICRSTRAITNMYDCSCIVDLWYCTFLNEFVTFSQGQS